MRPLDPRLLRHARRVRLPIAVVTVLGVTTGALVIIQAQLLATAITGRGSGMVLIVLALVVVLRALAAWGTEVAAYRASSAAKSTLREMLLAKVISLGPRWLAGERTASLTALCTSGVEGLDGYFGQYLPQLVLAVVVPAAVIVRVGLADPLAGLTILGTLPLIPVFGALIGRAAGGYAERRWQALAVLSHHFLDVVTGLATLKVFGRAKAQRSAVGTVTEEYRTATMGTLRVAFLSGLVLELVATMSVALVAVGVGLSLVYGHLSLRTGLLALILAPEAYLPLRQAAAQFHAVSAGVAAISEALTILELPAPPAPADGGGCLRADGVSVTHPGRPGAAPGNVSLEVRPGEITVLTGPSGCGKSTLIDVLLGFASPSSGQVQAPARSEIGWVPQEPYLFPGTVESNIRLGAPSAPAAAVAAAAAAAGLDDVPLDRQVTERSGGLSAGQRRRVALARALLPGRPFLILDEPTAGLDPDREDHVLRALRAEADAGRAVLIAAHHPAVIAIADQVVHLGLLEGATP